MIKIIHIITGLGCGGAENMLYKLLKHSDKEKYYHEVISLMDEGVMGDKIRNEGVIVHTLNISKANLISSLFEVKKICKDFDIVNTWLYHADFIGFIISKILLKKKLIWNVRHSNLRKQDNKRSTLTLIKINAFLSKRVDLITYNSNEALKNHGNIGYTNKDSRVIYNGFDLGEFKFDEIAREQIRKELGINNETKVLITVGRWYLQKDYPTLIESLCEVREEKSGFLLVMCGLNLDNSNRELVSLLTEYNMTGNTLLLGRRNDISKLLSAADIYISSSLGESFSNAIGEAMACQLPCIVTDVGESRYLVGDSGKVVNPAKPLELKKAIIMLLEKDGEEIKSLGVKARKRIGNLFGIEKITKSIEDTFLIL